MILSPCVLPDFEITHKEKVNATLAITNEHFPSITYDKKIDPNWIKNKYFQI